MSLRPDDIKPFPTAFGRNLLAEVPNFVAAPYLVVTMADLWPNLAPLLPGDAAVYFVRSMERAELEGEPETYDRWL